MYISLNPKDPIKLGGDCSIFGYLTYHLSTSHANLRGYDVHSRPINIQNFTSYLINLFVLPGTSRWLSVLYFLSMLNLSSRSLLSCIPNCASDTSINSCCIFIGPACHVISPRDTALSNTVRAIGSGH